MADKNLHKDHRKRLRKRYAEEGIDFFEDHNVLELLLFYALPRVDTNPIAHRLISRFGSLSGVFSASEDELCEVEGMGKASAGLLSLSPTAQDSVSSGSCPGFAWTDRSAPARTLSNGSAQRRGKAPA